MENLEEVLWAIHNLIEKLPVMICDELEKRSALQKDQEDKERKARLEADMDFLREHNAEINKLMYGLCAPVKVEADNPEEQHIADQLEKMYNAVYTECKECNGNKS